MLPAPVVSLNMANCTRHDGQEGECRKKGRGWVAGCVVKGVVISILSVSWGKNISAAVTMAPEFVLD